MMIAIKSFAAGIILVELEGSLDVSGAANIEEGMKSLAAKEGHVLVDVSKVSFVSSQGVRVLVVTAKALGNKGRRMVLVGPRPDVRRALKIMSIDTIIPVVDSTESGTKLLSGE